MSFVFGGQGYMDRAQHWVSIADCASVAGCFSQAALNQAQPFWRERRGRHGPQRDLHRAGQPCPSVQILRRRGTRAELPIQCVHHRQRRARGQRAAQVCSGELPGGGTCRHNSAERGRCVAHRWSWACACVRVRVRACACTCVRVCLFCSLGSVGCGK